MSMQMLASMMRPREAPEPVDRLREAVVRLVDGLHAALPDVCRALGPIRANPKRTYDPTSTEATVIGQHIPTQLARLATSDKLGWSTLQTSLTDFGRRSGLFRGIKVQILGMRKDRTSVPDQTEGYRH